MKKPVIFLTVVLSLASVAADAQSLGELAREEQRRREEIHDDKLIVGSGGSTVENEDEEGQDADSKTAEGSEKPGLKGGGSESGAPAENTEEAKEGEKADPDEPADFEGRGESYWRKTMEDARARLQELEDKDKELASERNEQQRRFSRTDGVRRNEVQKDIQKNIYERDQNKEALEKARWELESLRNEGQSSGALPGWLE